MIRQVGVVLVVALVRVVFKVVNAEAHCARREIGQIGQDGDEDVPALASKNQIMRRIMDDHVVGMVRERANKVGDQKTEPPIMNSELSHSKSDPGLKNDD